jgi:hypothetical protein
MRVWDDDVEILLQQWLSLLFSLNSSLACWIGVREEKKQILNNNTKEKVFPLYSLKVDLTYP